MMAGCCVWKGLMSSETRSTNYDARDYDRNRGCKRNEWQEARQWVFDEPEWKAPGFSHVSREQRWNGRDETMSRSKLVSKSRERD
jgi:hypothetical protein